MADKKRAFLVDYAQLHTVHNVHVSRPAENPKEGSCPGGENNRATENQTCKSIFRVNPES